MKVIDHEKNAKGRTQFTFEILPPLKGQDIQSIFDAIDPLMEFKPPFIDVTYHREEYNYVERENGLLEKRVTRKATWDRRDLCCNSKPLPSRRHTPYFVWWF